MSIMTCLQSPFVFKVNETDVFAFIIDMEYRNDGTTLCFAICATGFGSGRAYLLNVITVSFSGWANQLNEPHRQGSFHDCVKTPPLQKVCKHADME